MVLAAVAATAVLPMAAQAANYFGLGIDRKALSMTDLRSPRMTAAGGEAYKMVLYRTSVKMGKATADYALSKLDIDCSGGRIREEYIAYYKATGDFASSNVKPTAWRKVAPGSTDNALKNLACMGVRPQAGFSVGDKLLRDVIAAYRAGIYDRNIR